MARYQVHPLRRGQIIDVRVPGSKSITNRGLMLAAMAQGETVLRGVLFSEDSRVFMKALQTLGYSLDIDEIKQKVTIHPVEQCISGANVYVGSAGTAARFLTAFVSLKGISCSMTSSKQMEKRPMKDLLVALENLGTRIEYLDQPYHFPFNILGRDEKGIHEVELNIDASSQYLSALLMAGVLLPNGLSIKLTGNRQAKSYVDITTAMMSSFGVSVKVEKESYSVDGGICYQGMDYRIEPDVSAACYFYGMAALIGGQAKVRHVSLHSMQGDIRFIQLLDKMGCHVSQEGDGVVVKSPSHGLLSGVDINMSDFSDQTMTLAAMAPFLQGPTTIRGVEHIRRQESDRIHGIVTELTRVGIEVEEHTDGVTIYPGQVKAGCIHTYEDHRMAMAFALMGCVVPGIEIDNPECCKKTFENYFQVLDTLNEVDKP